MRCSFLLITTDKKSRIDCEETLNSSKLTIVLTNLLKDINSRKTNIVRW